MTDTTKIILEIINNFESLNIDFSYAEEFMEYDYKIKKILRYMEAIKKDGKYVFDKLTKCNDEKCKKEMPEHCYIDKFGRIVKNDKNCSVTIIHKYILLKYHQSATSSCGAMDSASDF